MANRAIKYALTDTEIKKAKANEKPYTLPDGNGLQLLVKTNGSKVWEIRYTIHGKTTKTTAGTYPTVSLASARKKRDEYKQLAQEGKNPVEVKRKKEIEVKREQEGQFHIVVKEWADNLKCSEGHAKKRYRAFERDIFPYFCKYDKNHKIESSRHIKDIGHAELLKAIKEKERTAPETAKRLFQDSRLLWQYAISHDYTEVLITLKIDKTVLPKPPTRHFPKITDRAILKELLQKIEDYQGNPVTRLMLKLVCIIPLRPENLCKLRWEQIDLDKALITIARNEMKVKDPNLPDFTVPLPHQAVDILKQAYVYTGWGKWVFCGARNINTHINLISGSRALSRMGFNDASKGRKQTLHSFRGTFRSLAETHRMEHNATFETIERCLDHQEKNLVVRAYAHAADYVEQMRVLFEWWANWLDEVKR